MGHLHLPVIGHFVEKCWFEELYDNLLKVPASWKYEEPIWTWRFIDSYISSTIVSQKQWGF